MRLRARVRAMKYGEFKQHIKEASQGRENFAPAYIVYGDDDYLKSSAIKALKNLVDPEYADFNLSTASGDDGVSSAIDALYTFPMFDERKVVVLTLDGAISSASKDAYEKYLASPSETSVLAVDCDDEVAKSLKNKKAQAVDCSRLEDSELAKEIEEIASYVPARKIDKDAEIELVTRTQGNMSRIATELVKLKAYCDEVITKRDVEDMVSADIDFQIYELANAVSEKNANKALEVLDVFFKNGIRGVTVINRLYDKYRNMLHAELNKNLSNEEVAKLLGMKSGAVYFLRKVSSNYSQMRLKKCVDYLHALQYDVLSGKRSDVSAIHEAILQLLNI